MQQLHEFVQSEYMFGFSERGERCKGHGPLPVNTSVLTLRRRVPKEVELRVQESRGHKLPVYGEVEETWCQRCADLMDIKVGPRGGPIVRMDSLTQEAQLIASFWRGFYTPFREKIHIQKKWY